MVVIDILIVALAAWGAWRGYRGGLMAGLGSLAGLVAGVVACRLLADVVYAVMCRHTDAASWPAAPYTGMTVACVAVFLPVWAACAIAGKALRGLLSALWLGPLDRICGALLGAVKWMFAVSVALNVCYMAAPYGPLFRNGRSALLEAAMEFAPVVWGMDVTAVSG